MVFGDVTVGLDTVAGGTVTGMLVVVMAAFLRRTKDTDERRDEGTRILIKAAADREARAWAERDRANAERDLARNETERIRERYELERQKWEEQMRWTRKKLSDLQEKTGETEIS